MQSTIFDWWKSEGGTLAELAQRLGYSESYIRHLAAGDYPLSKSFRFRCQLMIGPFVTQFLTVESPVSAPDAL